jgi:hypothetical protein
MRKSAKLGRSTSVEVQNISDCGIWLLIGKYEYFLKYDDFPWFQNATVRQISNVDLIHGEHLHWPDLDVDLELETLRDVEKYPLVYKKSV